MEELCGGGYIDHLKPTVVHVVPPVADTEELTDERQGVGELLDTDNPGNALGDRSEDEVERQHGADADGLELLVASRVLDVAALGGVLEVRVGGGLRHDGG